MIGNHELLNLKGQLHDVSHQDVSSFGGFDQRRHEFSNSGTIGKQIRSFSLAYKHNRVLFVHGGISFFYARRALNYMHLYNVSDPLEALNAHSANLISREQWNDKLFGYDVNAGLVQGQYQFSAGPLWFRGYANVDHMKNKTKTCLDLQKSLEVFDADIMVIGHVNFSIH
jgi:hypothetical protein